MTEINKNTEKRDIHWTGFAVGLIGSPLLISAALLGSLRALDLLYDSDDIRGLMAAVTILIGIGITLYLCIGIPVLIFHLHRNVPRVGQIVILSLVSLLWLLPIGVVVSLVTFDPTAIFFAAISICFGLFGAPLLAAVFALIYIRFADTGKD